MLYEAIRDGRLERPVQVPVFEAPRPGKPPYKGLQYFEEGDAALFFGREEITARLVGRLDELLSQEYRQEGLVGGRFLAIVGASGSGKSSLLRAGLVPALKNKEGAIDRNLSLARNRWGQVYLLTPTAHPLETLAITLTRQQASVKAATELIDSLRDDPRSLHLHASQICLDEGRLLLIIDQFEELFTLCRDEVERVAFIENLLTAAESSGPSVIVIALRADFYAHCAQYERLRQALGARQEYIGAMDAVELRRAIEEPARQGGWELEAGLVDVILHDVGKEPGVLPLLSHALIETWQRRTGLTLTHRGYAEAGGVRGAIARTAEVAYERLSPEEQAVARLIFLRLTELGEGTQDTRRRVTQAELVSLSEEAPLVDRVLRRLADARLITMSADTVEVAHEALIREWPTLRDWLNEDREGLRQHRHLTGAALAWQELDRDPGELYRGARLTQALEWAEKPEWSAAMNELEHTFLAVSLASAQGEAEEREAARQRELESARALAESEKQRAGEQTAAAIRLRWRAYYLAGALILALLMAGAALLYWGRATTTAERNAALAAQNAANVRLALTQQALAQSASTQAVAQASTRATAEAVALQQRDLASQQAQLAAARELALAANNSLNQDPERSILLALQAVSLTTNAGLPAPYEVQEALHRAVQNSRASLTLNAHQGDVSAIAYSPDGARLASAGIDGTAKVWDAETGELLLTITGYTGAVNDAAFNPDGSRWGTAGADQTARVWDSQTGEEQLTLSGHTGEVTSATFSPDGRRLATTSADGTAKIWDAVTGEDILTLIGHTGWVNSVTFHPDGTHLATVGVDGTARIWDAWTGKQLRQLAGQDGELVGITFSPDGARLATCGTDGKARIWDTTTGQLLQTFSGHRILVRGLAFTPDGKYLVTGSQDGTAKVWDAESGEELFTLSGHAGAVDDVAVSPRCVSPPETPFVWCGPWLATAGRDGTARVWNISPTGGSEMLVVPGFYGVFSSDGNRLKVMSQVEAGTLDMQTWQTSIGRPGRRLSTVSLAGFPAPVVAGDITQDGTRLITVSADGTAQVWDTDTGESIFRFPLSTHTEGVNDIAISPDGKLLATASDDGTARIWDLESGQELAVLTGHTGFIWSVAFSPDGAHLATGGTDQTVRLWDAVTGEEMRTLTGHTFPVNVVEFSPDGKQLVSGSMDATARVWDVETGEARFNLNGHTASVISAAFSPDGMLLATGSYDGKGKLWDVSDSSTAGQSLLDLDSPGWPTSISFSPDGSRLVTGSWQDMKVRIYLLDVEDLAVLARSRLTRSLTLEECRKYLHRETCP